MTLHSLLFAAALLFTACQSSGPPVSGILGDRSVFEKRSDDLLVHQVATEEEFAKYDKVLLEPVLIYLERNSDWSAISPSAQRQFKTLLRDALKRELSKSFEVVFDPGAMAEDVVIVRAAITDVTTPRDGKKGSNLATSTIELELLDGATRKRLVAVVSRSTVDTGADTPEEREAEARHIVDGWATGLREWLDEVMAGATS